MTCVYLCDSQRIDGPNTERFIYYNSLIFEGKGCLTKNLKLYINLVSSVKSLMESLNGVREILMIVFSLFRMYLLPTAPDSV